MFLNFTNAHLEVHFWKSTFVSTLSYTCRRYHVKPALTCRKVIGSIPLTGLKIIFERWPVLFTGQTHFSSVMSFLTGQNIEKIYFEEFPY